MTGEPLRSINAVQAFIRRRGINFGSRLVVVTHIRDERVALAGADERIWSIAQADMSLALLRDQTKSSEPNKQQQEMKP